MARQRQGIGPDAVRVCFRGASRAIWEPGQGGLQGAQQTHGKILRVPYVSPLKSMYVATPDETTAASGRPQRWRRVFQMVVITSVTKTLCTLRSRHTHS